MAISDWIYIKGSDLDDHVWVSVYLDTVDTSLFSAVPWLGSSTVTLTLLSETRLKKKKFAVPRVS